MSSIRAMKGLIVENERRVGHLKSGLQTVLVGGLVGAAAFGLAKLRTKFMRLFLLGFFSAFALIIVAGFACIELGLAPVATSSPPLPFERLITGIALDARVGKEAPTSSPIQPSEDVYFAGAKIYENNCAVCHGLPGQEQTPIARGEFPKPPKLFQGKGVSDDPAGVTYWKVANGIRLTGMPGFDGSLTPEQMWQVSLLLANSDKLPPKVLSTLQAGTPPSGNQ